MTTYWEIIFTHMLSVLSSRAADRSVVSKLPQLVNNIAKYRPPNAITRWKGHCTW